MFEHGFFFARHGETEWNTRGLLQGHTDIPLNENGRKQAEAAAPFFKDRGITAIVTSDLGRARETAEILNAMLGVALSIDADLRERHYGDYEGKTLADYDAFKKAVLAQGGGLEENTYPCPPGGEVYAAFSARVQQALRRHQGLHGAGLLVVAHGGVFRALRRALIGDDKASGNVQPFWFDRQAADGWILRDLSA